MTESARKNVGGVDQHVEYLRSETGTPHTIGAKRLNLGFFLHVCGLSHFEDLIRFKKSFSVYPALDERVCVEHHQYLRHHRGLPSQPLIGQTLGDL